MPHLFPTLLKMMENALDTLKTAFPHPESLSPVEDLEGDADGRTMDNRKYRWEIYMSPNATAPKSFFMWLYKGTVRHFEGG